MVPAMSSIPVFLVPFNSFYASLASPLSHHLFIQYHFDMQPDHATSTCQNIFIFLFFHVLCTVYCVLCTGTVYKLFLPTSTQYTVHSTWKKRKTNFYFGMYWQHVEMILDEQVMTQRTGKWWIKTIEWNRNNNYYVHVYVLPKMSSDENHIRAHLEKYCLVIKPIQNNIIGWQKPYQHQ